MSWEVTWSTTRLRMKCPFFHRFSFHMTVVYIYNMCGIQLRSHEGRRHEYVQGASGGADAVKRSMRAAQHKHATLRPHTHHIPGVHARTPDPSPAPASPTRPPMPPPPDGRACTSGCAGPGHPAGAWTHASLCGQDRGGLPDAPPHGPPPKPHKNCTAPRGGHPPTRCAAHGARQLPPACSGTPTDPIIPAVRV